MKHSDIVQQLQDYIAQSILHGKDIGLDEQTPLLEWGILNSIEVMRLLTFINERFHINIPPGKLVVSNFSTIDSLTKVVEASITESLTK